MCNKTTLNVIRENKVFFFGDGVYRNCFYEYIGYRCPNRGEFYLSGAEIHAYRAHADLSTRYHVVRPTVHAVSVTAWIRGEEIEVRELS